MSREIMFGSGAILTDDTGRIVITTDPSGASAPGESHLGEVGGYKESSSIEFTRPADTTAYAALDVIGVNLAVSGATNATPIVITSTTHGLADGDPVTIASVGGNTNANGDYFVKVTGYSTTTFALYTDAALTTPKAGNSNYTSGGTIAKLFKFPNMGRIAAQNGYIIKANLMTDQKTCVARIKVHLFNQPVTALLDNVPYTKLWANRTKRSGEILFPAMTTEDSSGSTAAGSLVVPSSPSSNLPLPYGCFTSDTAMYALFETLDAFTPASAQNFYIRLMLEGD